MNHTTYTLDQLVAIIKNNGPDSDDAYKEFTKRWTEYKQTNDPNKLEPAI